MFFEYRHKKNLAITFDTIFLLFSDRQSTAGFASNLFSRKSKGKISNKFHVQ